MRTQSHSYHRTIGTLFTFDLMNQIHLNILIMFQAIFQINCQNKKYVKYWVEYISTQRHNMDTIRLPFFSSYKVYNGVEEISVT